MKIIHKLTKNVSWQCAQVTRHIPGTEGTDWLAVLGDKFMILLQVGRGQAMRCEVALQISKQLQGHLTYFFPGGALRIGYE